MIIILSFFFNGELYSSKLDESNSIPNRNQKNRLSITGFAGA